VHESDENHGGAPSSPEIRPRSPEIARDHPRSPEGIGAPLEELRDQCPDECQSHLFGIIIRAIRI